MSALATVGPRVLVTGASGYLGALVIDVLSKARGTAPEGVGAIIASDLGVPIPARRLPGVDHRRLDVRDRSAVAALVGEVRPDVIVHLAAIVTPPRGAKATLAWDVDVAGTRHVLDAALAHGVGKLIVTSSGAAYGYHADNPPLIDEDAPLRGNEVFAYSHHKRLVEGLLADYRARHPELRQLILRPGTILGAGTKNQITAIFERPVVLGLDGVASPFNFVWDEDVARFILQGVLEPELTGIYNVAGDGVMTLREIAGALQKRYVALSPGLVRGALALLSRLGIAPYGPEQVLFLQHRPVLDNARLVERFGRRPRSTREVFDIWRRAHV